MSLPGQMFDHMLNAEKGWPSQTALDFSAKISANVLYDLRPGQVCHLNSSGELEPGVVAWQMGLFIFQGTNDLDVNNANNGQWYPISPSGRVMALVAKGPFELWTTEFADQTYVRNQPLRAPTGNTSGDEDISGVLTNQSVVAIGNGSSNSASFTAVCGIVSQGVKTNAYGKSVLCFWPVWYPGNSAET
jgi:hypothetical protein